MDKVKLDVLRPWINKKITEYLNIEDDVVVEFVYNQLEDKKFPCPKKMQINMTAFLDGKNARQFMDELWALLLSAQASESGIPELFIQQKKDEILKRDESSKQHEKNETDGNRAGRYRPRYIVHCILTQLTFQQLKIDVGAGINNSKIKSDLVRFWPTFWPTFWLKFKMKFEPKFRLEFLPNLI